MHAVKSQWTTHMSEIMRMLRWD